MPDKPRHRKGRQAPKPDPTEVSIERQINDDYRRWKRSGHYHDNRDWYGGGTSQLFMDLAKKYKMPIARVKNIVNFEGISDRPMPVVTPEILRERQEKKGELMAENIRRNYAHELWWLLWRKDRDANKHSA